MIAALAAMWAKFTAWLSNILGGPEDPPPPPR